MSPIKAKIHFHREQRDIQIPPRPQQAIDSQVIFNGNCPHNCPVPMGKYRLGQKTSPNESSELYAFKDSIDYNSHGHEFVLSTMHIPNYFDGMAKSKSGINGQFLLPIAGGVQTLKITQEIGSVLKVGE